MTERGRSITRITALLYPFGVGAMAVNVFFASLIGSWVGLPVLSATVSIILGALIAIPATWAFSVHIFTLMQQAEDLTEQ